MKPQNILRILDLIIRSLNKKHFLLKIEFWVEIKRWPNVFAIHSDNQMSPSRMIKQKKIKF